MGLTWPQGEKPLIIVLAGRSAPCYQPAGQLNTMLAQLKEFVEILEAGVTIAALTFGAIWGYLLFVRNRQKYPRAAIKHDISDRPISDKQVLVHVNVIVSNLGEVLLSPVSMETRIHQVLPPPTGLVRSIQQGHDPVEQDQTEIEWPVIKSRELKLKKREYEVEPSKSQTIQCDFLVDKGVETISVYTYLQNESKRRQNIGWDATTLYDLSKTE